MPQTYRKYGNTCIRGGKIQGATANGFAKEKEILCRQNKCCSNITAWGILYSECSQWFLNKILEKEQHLLLITITKYLS